MIMPKRQGRGGGPKVRSRSLDDLLGKRVPQIVVVVAAAEWDNRQQAAAADWDNRQAVAAFHAFARARHVNDNDCYDNLMDKMFSFLIKPRPPTPSVEMPDIDVPLRKCIDLPVLGSFLLHFFSLHIFFHVILPQSHNNCIINSSVFAYIGTAFLAVYTIIHFMATKFLEKVKIFYCGGKPHPLQLISTLRRVRIACFLSVTCVLSAISLTTIATGRPRITVPKDGCINTWFLSIFIIIFLSPQIDFWWNIGFQWILKRRANINLDGHPECDAYALCGGALYGIGIAMALTLAYSIIEPSLLYCGSADDVVECTILPSPLIYVKNFEE